jgi:ABC-type oligopeptide transport system substrate-binding subunit
VLGDSPSAPIELCPGGFVPRAMAGHLVDDTLAYNPQRARRFLAEAGYPGGAGFPEVEYQVFATPGVDQAIELTKRSLYEVLGVTVHCQAVEWTAYHRLLESAPPHMGIMPWAADYPDPDNFLRVAYRHIQRYFGWRDERYERLIEQGRQLTEQAARLALYRQADAILLREAAIVPVFNSPLVCLVKPWVQGYPPACSLGGLALWKALRDVVILTDEEEHVPC